MKHRFSVSASAVPAVAWALMLAHPREARAGDFVWTSIAAAGSWLEPQNWTPAGRGGGYPCSLQDTAIVSTTSPTKVILEANLSINALHAYAFASVLVRLPEAACMEWGSIQLGGDAVLDLQAVLLPPGAKQHATDEERLTLIVSNGMELFERSEVLLTGKSLLRGGRWHFRDYSSLRLVNSAAAGALLEFHDFSHAACKGGSAIMDCVGMLTGTFDDCSLHNLSVEVQSISFQDSRIVKSEFRGGVGSNISVADCICQNTTITGVNLRVERSLFEGMTVIHGCNVSGVGRDAMFVVMPTSDLRINASIFSKVSFFLSDIYFIAGYRILTTVSNNSFEVVLGSPNQTQVISGHFSGMLLRVRCQISVEPLPPMILPIPIPAPAPVIYPFPIPTPTHSPPPAPILVPTAPAPIMAPAPDEEENVDMPVWAFALVILVAVLCVVSLGALICVLHYNKKKSTSPPGTPRKSVPPLVPSTSNDDPAAPLLKPERKREPRVPKRDTPNAANATMPPPAIPSRKRKDRMRREEDRENRWMSFVKEEHDRQIQHYDTDRADDADDVI